MWMYDFYSSLIDSPFMHLSRDALSRYPEIRLLQLVHTNIVELEKGAFIQSKLIWLILTNNYISEILPEHLKGLDKLKKLELSKNEIVRADLSDLENSTTVHLM